MRGSTAPGTYWIDPDQIVTQLPVPLVVFDLRDRVRTINQAAAKLLRSSPEEILQRSIEALVASPSNVGKNSSTLMHGGSFRSRPMVWKGGDDALVEVLATASLIRDDLGCPVGTAYLLEAVTDPERADPIRYQALHDSLTGLPNRVALTAQLQALLDDRDHRGRAPGLLYMDLDHFSRINDSLGHEAGDGVLREVGRRIQHELRGEDLVSRYGGDVFAVALDLASPNDASFVAEKLLRAIRRPFSWEGRELGLTASIGIATCPPDGETPSMLVQRATGAANEAKRLGADRWMLGDEEVQQGIRSRFEIESRLRTSIRAEGLSLHFQPIVATDDGRLLGCEALLRWPGAEELSIETVIRVAEEIGLIAEVGQWVRERVLEEAHELPGLAPECRISCNVSPRELEDPGFLDRIERLLERQGVPRAGLELEITETALMADPGRVVEILRGLRRRGVSLAVDDFGAGHASLGYIRNLPIDTLKIDRSLVHDIGTLNGEALIRSILTLAEVLRLGVVAEGVETEEQREFLARHGCLAAQGFLFAAPMDVESLHDWIRNRADSTGPDRSRVEETAER